MQQKYALVGGRDFHTASLFSCTWFKHNYTGSAYHEFVTKEEYASTDVDL